jgi:hypothetical protein
VSVELYRHLDPAGLRLLIELSSLRTLADRGLSDQELAVSRQLARATMRSARAADVSGYLESDVAFHEYLLGLAGGRDRCGVARRLLARDAEEDGPAGSDLRESMIAGASEHGKILDLLANDKAAAAADLLRDHVAGDRAGRYSSASTDETRADLDAFFRHQRDAPVASPASLSSALGQLRGPTIRLSRSRAWPPRASRSLLMPAGSCWPTEGSRCSASRTRPARLTIQIVPPVRWLTPARCC